MQLHPGSPDLRRADSMENGDDGLMVGPGEVRERRLVIGIDYGTTFTGVAYATPLGNTCSLDEIDVNLDWGPEMDNSEKVPSVISYPDQRWGSSVNPNAVTMVHTKLELDVGEVNDELDLLLHQLDGMKNLSFRHLVASDRLGGRAAYTQKTSEEIVTDYLTRVFECLLEVINTFSEELRRIIPTDIVVTVPTKWSYKAMNSTYRALTKAGFNHYYFPMLKEVIFVTESEAAAIYTARYLKNRQGTDFLRLNEPFILCDAGGGTVDVVSYRVTQLHPILQIEKIGEPTGRKCGSVFINMSFKRWLRGLIGDEHYRDLDPELEGTKISSHSVEGPAMRELMRDFNARKEIFHSNYGQDLPIDLPHPKENLNIPGRVNQGQVRITSKQMEVFFDGCVGQIVDLIRGHKYEIQKKGTGVRLRNVIMVGGFGESRYLQEQIEQHLGLTGIQLRRPDTSWTAVVQGAVLCGIEKSSLGSLPRANFCRHHYGICSNQLFSAAYHTEADLARNDKSGLALAEGQLLWFLSKGDLVPSTKPLIVTKKVTLDLLASEPRKKTIQFYRYSYDDRPTRYQSARNELDEVCSLEVDLSSLPDSALHLLRRKPDVFQLVVEVKMRLQDENLSVSVSWANEPGLLRVLSQQSNIPY